MLRSLAVRRGHPSPRLRTSEARQPSNAAWALGVAGRAGAAPFGAATPAAGVRPTCSFLFFECSYSGCRGRWVGVGRSGDASSMGREITLTVLRIRATKSAGSRNRGTFPCLEESRSSENTNPLGCEPRQLPMPTSWTAAGDCQVPFPSGRKRFSTNTPQPLPRKRALGGRRRRRRVAPPAGAGERGLAPGGARLCRQPAARGGRWRLRRRGKDRGLVFQR